MSSECCDVIVAHSPPIFTGHNAQPELSVLYQNWLVISQKQQSPLAVRRYSARSSESPTREDNKQQQAVTPPTQDKTKTRRPCLVIRADSDASIGSTSSSSSSSSSSSDENEPSSPTRRKKKVVFADDRGLSLTHVRLMNEPSNQPPKLMAAGPYLKNGGDAAAFASPTGQSSAASAAAGVPGLGMSAARLGAADQAQWRLWFPQPASNYLDFRRRLDVDNVSLENVIVKPADRWIVGTVKVRNLSYDKDVFVRCTRDKWATHQDTVCAYVQNNAMVTAAASCSPHHHGQGSGCNGHGHGHGHGNNNGNNSGGVAAIYDTFSFRLPLPRDAAAMEFAVCYKSPEFECWDNNDGRNYALSLHDPSAAGQQPAAAVHGKPPLSPSLSAPQLLLPPSSAASASLSSYEAAKQPVHYFGAQSKHNSWGAFRDPLHKKSSSAYW